MRLWDGLPGVDTAREPWELTPTKHVPCPGGPVMHSDWQTGELTRLRDTLATRLRSTEDGFPSDVAHCFVGILPLLYPTLLPLGWGASAERTRQGFRR